MPSSRLSSSQVGISTARSGVTQSQSTQRTHTTARTATTAASQQTRSLAPSSSRVSASHHHHQHQKADGRTAARHDTGRSGRSSGYEGRSIRSGETLRSSQIDFGISTARSSRDGGYPQVSPDTARSSSCYSYVHMSGYGGHKPDNARNAKKVGKTFQTGNRPERFQTEAPLVGVGAHQAKETTMHRPQFKDFERLNPHDSARQFCHNEGYSGHVPQAPSNLHQYGNTFKAGSHKIALQERRV